jgi:hypothetical protein
LWRELHTHHRIFVLHLLFHYSLEPTSYEGPDAGKPDVNFYAWKVMAHCVRRFPRIVIKGRNFRQDVHSSISLENFPYIQTCLWNFTLLKWTVRKMSKNEL